MDVPDPGGQGQGMEHVGDGALVVLGTFCEGAQAAEKDALEDMAGMGRWPYPSCPHHQGESGWRARTDGSGCTTGGTALANGGRGRHCQQDGEMDAGALGGSTWTQGNDSDV